MPRRATEPKQTVTLSLPAATADYFRAKAHGQPLARYLTQLLNDMATPVAQPRQSAPPIRPADCRHPVNRRMKGANVCMLCGVHV